MSASISAAKRPRKKQRRPTEQQAVLGDGQATHTYEHKDDEELRLENVLFGIPLAGDSSRNTQTSTTREDTSMRHFRDEELFFNDIAPTSGIESQPVSDVDGKHASREGATSSPIVFSPTSRKKAAWSDPDDHQLDVSIASDRRLRKLRDAAAEDRISGREYESRLRRQFEKVHPVPQWAASRSKRTRRASQSPDSDANSGSEDEPKEDPTTGPIDIVAAPLDSLAPNELAITRLRDANQASRSDGAVNAIEFHPSARVPVLMVAGADKRIRLFNIDGLTNPLLQTLHIPTLPPNKASFHPSGASVLLAGPRPFVCVYDLQSSRVSTHQISGRAPPSAKADTQDRSCDINAFSPDGRTLAIVGRQGRVRLLDWASMSVVAEIKATATVKSVWWRSDDGASTTSGEMYTLDANAEICAWDARTRRCLRKWKDDGGYGTVMATEAAGRYTAIGSKSGIVNIYDTPSTRCSSDSSPAPLKTLPHLTTAVTSLRFNHDAQILASASKTKKDQLKLVHTKTLTTFANWPTSGTPLGHVTSLDFSTGSEYLAIGNTRGTVLLYNLRHYAARR